MGLLASLFQALFIKRTRVPLFLVTFDALGTLYRFRQPVANQYLDIARKCGLEAKVDLKELDQAFRRSFKHHNSEYPNYGKGKLEGPNIWWDLVVTRAFDQVVKGGKSSLPPELGSALYTHFSSGAAYEPFPDVRPFLQSMAALKRLCTDPDGPIILTGVVTNSDPRVKTVLQDMGFRVGSSRIPDFRDVRRIAMEDRSTTSAQSMFRDYYNLDNDFDIISTSYDAGAEKPHPRVWFHAELLSEPTVLSRGEQNVEETESLRENTLRTLQAAKYRTDDSKKVRIHIGDEYSKDYVGARNARWEALLLAREDDEAKELGRNVKVVRSLDEVTMIVNIMANAFLDQAKT